MTASAVALGATLRHHDGRTGTFVRREEDGRYCVQSLKGKGFWVFHPNDCEPDGADQYDLGRRAMLNALLELNPGVARNLHAIRGDDQPFNNEDGKLPFDVAFWITSVAAQLNITPREEAPDWAAATQAAWAENNSHEAPGEGAGEIAKVLEFYGAEWDYHPGDGEAPDATHPGSAPTFYEAEPTDALKDDGGMMARVALADLRARSSAPEAREGEPVAWRPIDSAPKDGTAIDVWRDEGGRETVYWGYPPHECGEMGGLCDSDWHSIRAAGWVCNTFGEFLGRNHNPFTHWQPLPTGPSSTPDALKGAAK